MKEVTAGWLTPAVSSDPQCVAKRFPLKQKTKLRMIDDFPISGVNSSHGMTERLRAQAIDELSDVFGLRFGPQSVKETSLLERSYLRSTVGLQAVWGGPLAPRYHEDCC